ncbi:unnamed protein product [Soboliphyme baturini]|uniref:Craniofacial development protein 2-like n=1 Tax=Soboliphyme baturini TaxID=241478 RepID=A0A183INP3_9BILA|nr:unnamed protein product [Soboliphyme baturini]
MFSAMPISVNRQLGESAYKPVRVLLLRLDSNKTLRIVQVYAPTTASDDDEVEEFYAELESTLTIKSIYTRVMGDINAKLGQGGKAGEKHIGRFGIGKRTNRSERMVSMTESDKLFVGSTWFRKKVGRRWTWITPNAVAKNEIDYNLVDRQCILKP